MCRTISITKMNTKIEDRVSYRFFVEEDSLFQEMGLDELTRITLLKHLWGVRDTYGGWGSATLSEYARESLNAYGRATFKDGGGSTLYGVVLWEDF